MLRSLENYKEMHKERAKEKGVLQEFMECKTLTAARKIVFGEKQRTPNCGRCHHKTTDCTCNSKR